jgi:hypothetical protein
LLYLSAVTLVFALTVFQGGYGGEMVYSHGAGISETGKGTESPNASHERLEKFMKIIGSSHRANEKEEKNK